MNTLITLIDNVSETVYHHPTERRFSNASFGTTNGSIGPGDHRTAIELSSNKSTPFPSPPVQHKTSSTTSTTATQIGNGQAAVDVSDVKVSTSTTITKALKVIKPSGSSSSMSPSRSFKAPNGTTMVERSTSPFGGEEYPGARIHSNACTLL